MKCPYCAEEIDANAVVCCHCRHDLAFLNPVVKKLDLLENNILEVRSSLENLQSRFKKVHGEQKDYFLVSRIVLIIILPILITIGGYLLFISPDINYLNLIVWISILFTFPFGIWLGLSWKKYHLKEYILFGLIIGIVSQTVVYFIKHNYKFYGEPLFPLPVGWGSELILNVLMMFLIFVLGCIVGDFMEWKKSGAPFRSTLSQKWATSIARFTSKGSSKEGKASTIKMWSVILEVLKVILLVTGTIVALLQAIKSLTDSA